MFVLIRRNAGYIHMLIDAAWVFFGSEDTCAISGSWKCAGMLVGTGLGFCEGVVEDSALATELDV
jgi:hypothetical protein